jgi:Carboxypeptidase regulatory-like domain
MNFKYWRCALLRVALSLGAISSLCYLSPSVYAQETTGGLQGTVKDASGAVVPNAQVHVSSPSLVGGKSTVTDNKGNYRLVNLPPGPYVIDVTAKGFSTLKREGLVIEVGHLPTVDMTVTVGADTTVVEVSTESPAIDVTSVTTLTNVTQDVITYVPRGTSFQSVIQFAPSARNEPLMGNTTTNGSGSVSPGNGSNGSSFGYSIAGGSDSENSYLVEGQETANLIGGYSHTNVPFDFIQEVEVKSSGVQAEYGGALGGVVNVIMKKGTPQYHGSVFLQFENQGLDAGPNATARYDPLSSITPTNWSSSALPTCTDSLVAAGTACYQGFSDANYQQYQGVKDHYSDFRPGFTFGGPLLPFSSTLRDKLFFFVGFNPDFNRDERKVNYGPASAGNAATGVIPFSQNTNTYYTTARIDAQATKKIRVFGSWLYQLQRQNGQVLPFADSTTGAYNVSAGNSPANYAHSLGFDAPNTTINTGADITLTPSLVSTSRFGYYFENYHDFGFPEGGVVYWWQTNGLGATAGTLSGPLDQVTNYNASKAIEVSQDFAWFKSTKFGTHNFKFGYQMNRNSNNIQQIYNEPVVQLFPGTTSFYNPGSPLGVTNCAAISAQLGTPLSSQGGCQGPNGVGYATVYDFGTGGHATGYNHSFYGQNSWTPGRGITIDAGIRVEREYLPGESFGGGAPQKPINFGWKDKIAPRIGAAWDVFHDAKLKIFGGYGQFYDQMKLNVAISSFGGQYWNNCSYVLTDANYTSINPSFNSSGRYCPSGSTSTGANFGGSTPSNALFVENLNQRAFPTTCSTCSVSQEGVAPGLKPYEQHEALFGTDYQLTRTVALEVRYDRRRLDHVIEDAAVYNPAIGETFVIVNPGQGVNATVSGYCNFLYGYGAPGCDNGGGAYPANNNPQAARSYDGVEFRATKAMSNHWFGMFSYTYSHLRGNYTGLTSSDLSDGGDGGRNSPNNSRAFDEPYFQYNASGGSSSGLLPTDRPNTFKANAYYQFNWLHNFTTNFGIFQYFYQGSPNTSYANVGYSENAFPVKPFDWGKWANITQDPNTGAITVGTPYTYRNPWYNQTDFSFNQSYKIGEAKSLNFQSTFTNLFNQHSVTAVYSQIDSAYGGNQFITPGGQAVYNGIPFYAAATAPYNMQASLNGQITAGQFSNSQGGPETINSQLGKPLYWQHPRTIRLQASFSF